jgi:hypothetical protein
VAADARGGDAFNIAGALGQRLGAARMIAAPHDIDPVALDEFVSSMAFPERRGARQGRSSMPRMVTARGRAGITFNPWALADGWILGPSPKMTVLLEAVWRIPAYPRRLTRVLKFASPRT